MGNLRGKFEEEIEEASNSYQQASTWLNSSSFNKDIEAKV
jgi:hypothetical protein